MNNLLRLVVSFAAIDKLSGPLKNIVGLAQTGNERFAGMKRQARDLERELRDVQGQIARHDGFGSVGLRNRQAELEDQLARTNRQLERQARLLRIEANADRMRARGEALQSAGQSNVFGGLAMIAPLVLAGKGAADFQSGMTDIALKAELSRAETSRMQANILAAARASKQLPEYLRAGVDVLSGFGMTPQQAVQMIGPIGRVATAYKAEVDDLAAASFANFSNLKVPIAQNAKALEIMAAAGNAGAFEIKDMAQYFPTLTAQAQAYGQHGVAAVADLAAAAQIARKGTGDSASAATNLQNLLAKINTKETIDKFKKMGVDLPAALKKAYAEGKTPLEAIAGITEKTLGGKLDRMSFLFGDMQAQQALRPLIQNMEEYRRIRADALASSGAIDTAFARRSQDAATQVQALTGNLQRLAITLGPVILPPLVRLTEAALRITDRVTAWASANPKLASGLVMLVGGIGALRIGLGVLQFLLGGTIGQFATFYRFFKTNGEAIKAVFGGIRTAALFLGRGFLQAGAMMLANPIVLIVMAIAVAVGIAGYLIYSHWETIKAAFWGGVARVGAALEWAKQALGAGLTWLSGLPARFLALGAAMLDGLVSGITSRLGAVRKAIVGAGEQAVGWFKALLGIKSPSRVFMGLGGNIAAGLALGIANGQGAAAMAAQRMADQVAAVQSAAPIAVIAAGAPGDAAEPGASIASRGAIPALDLVPLKPVRTTRSASGGPGAAAAATFGDVHFSIAAQPGQSAREIAEEVRKILDDLAGEKAAARRSGFRDGEDED